MSRQFFLLAFILFANTVFGTGLLTISGSYQGKNVFIQNPAMPNPKEYCTKEVYVNDVKVMGGSKTPTYEIDLSKFKINQAILIKIVHDDLCSPKILNPYDLKVGGSFNFTALKVDQENITWATKGERSEGKIFVEQFLYNNWHTIKEIQGKESMILNSYDHPCSHHSGINRYRVKYVDDEGIVSYSKVVDFISTLPPIKFYPKRVIDKVHLSRTTDYEVLDKNLKTIKHGHSKEVNLSDLEMGVYYLNVDNLTLKVFKK
ncbi:MAG TPA: hypothetical protein VF691_18145 [Cytophagaceae bacterium]